MSLTGADDGLTRNMIAVTVVVVGVVSVIVLAIVAIATASDTKHDDAMQLVLTAILPLVGTWVGTVLAFYFARENMDAAARNTEKLLRLDERLGSIPVAEVMIPRSAMDALMVPDGADPASTTILEMRKALETKSRNRLPILKANGSVAYVVHRSTITEFITRQLIPGCNPDQILTMTIADVRTQAPELYEAITSFAFIEAKATLADAKRAMERKPKSQDVFVTTTGDPTAAVVGWVTNVTISHHSKAE